MSCFSELYLPGAESGHHALEQSRRVCSGPNQQWCGHDLVADVENHLSSPAGLSLPGKISSHSLNQTESLQWGSLGGNDALTDIYVKLETDSQ